LAHLKKLKKKDEPDSFSMFSDENLPDFSEFIPTGALAIDKLINGANGGWPIGGISECAAWEHVGKSTLLDQSMANAQRAGCVVVLIDSEKGRDKRWSTLLGLDLDTLINYQADTIEKGFSGIEQALTVQAAVMAEQAKKKRQAPSMLIVWDSLGGTPTKAELEGEPDDQYMAVAAKVIKMNFRRLTQRLAKLRCALVFANHFYEGIGAFSGGLKAYGGSGPRYHSDVRIWLKRTGQLKIGDGVVGHIIEAKTKKNRISGSQDPQDLALVYGGGIDNSYTLFEWGKKAANSSGNIWVNRNGAWYWLYPPDEDPISFQRQFLGLGELFKERPDIYQAMATQYLNE
jgi:recombination protein RecA